VTLKFGEAAALIDDQAAAGLCGAVQVGSGAVAELFDLVVSEVHRAPLTLDGVFDFWHRQVWQVALLAACLSSEAEEVVVLATPAFGGGVADSAAAAGTPKCALEVVGVPPGSVAGDATRGQYVLDALPEHVVDERLVAAVVDDAVEHELSLVVRVTQDPVQLAAVDRLADHLACRAALEAALFECVAQLRDRPLASGVLLECPAHVRRAFGVEGDGLDLDAVHPASGVEVAKWCDAVGATAANLLSHALLSFVGQVLGVVLGDGRHDAVQQRAGRTVVDLLAGRHQGGAGQMEDGSDFGIVDAGARQPVELVDNDVRDVANPNAVEHPLQSDAVGGPC
jgi:hypothetical protein